VPRPAVAVCFMTEFRRMRDEKPVHGITRADSHAGAATAGGGQMGQETAAQASAGLGNFPSRLFTTVVVALS